MKVVDNDFLKTAQGRLPNGVSSMVLGILSISLFFFYGAGIVLAMICRNQIKSDEEIYNGNPKIYRDSYKMTRVAKITSTWGLWVSIGFTILLIIVIIIDA